MCIKNHAPGTISMGSFLYKYIKKFGKPCTCRMYVLQNLCTRPPKCAHQVQGAPLIRTLYNVVFIAFHSQTQRGEANKVPTSQPGLVRAAMSCLCACSKKLPTLRLWVNYNRISKWPPRCHPTMQGVSYKRGINKGGRRLLWGVYSETLFTRFFLSFICQAATKSSS